MLRRGVGEITRGFVAQLFQAPEDYLAVVSPVVGTHRAIQTCHLRFSLYRVRRPGNAALFRWLAVARSRFAVFRLLARLLLLRELKRVAQTDIACDAVYDNSAVDVFVEAQADSRGKYFLLTIEAIGASAGNAATVWVCDEADRIEGHVRCEVDGHSDGGLGLVAGLGFANPVAPTKVPPSLLWSPITQCNLNCIHCISRFSRKSVSRLSDAVRAQIKRHFDNGQITFLNTDYSGDILWSDHRYGGELDYLLSLDVPFGIDTNGVYLTPENSERLMRSKLHSLTVSLDAARDTTFRRVRKGAPPLGQVLDNMKALAAARGRAGRKDICLSISFALMRSTIGELPEAIALVKETGFDMIFTNHLEAYTPDMDGESFWHAQDDYNRARAHAVAVAERLGVVLYMPIPFEPRPPSRGHTWCNDPWGAAMVLGNGEVRVCCIPGSEMLMGNLNQQSLEEIWNGQRYRQFRAAINTPNPPKPCSACPRRKLPGNRASYLLHEVIAESHGGTV